MDPSPDGGLLDTHALGEAGLRGPGFMQVAFESLHDANIGESYILSIGKGYAPLGHHPRMARRPQIRTFWARLKEALKDANLPATQEAAAKMIGISQPSISEWNEPNKYPEHNKIVFFAQKTGVCVEWLYLERGPKHPGPPEENTARQLWDIWPHLSELTKGTILGIALASASVQKADAPSQDLQRPTG